MLFILRMWAVVTRRATAALTFYGLVTQSSMRNAMLYRLIIMLALISCGGNDGDRGNINGSTKNPDPNTPSSPPDVKRAPPNPNPNPAAPPYSLTGGQAEPSWNSTAYNGLKVKGTLGSSNQGTFDVSKIVITATCGDKTGTNSSVANAAFSDVLVEISDLTPSDLVSCTVAVTYDGADIETGEVAYDKVIELGKKYSAGDLTGTACTDIRGLWINLEDTRFYILRYSAADYSNATYLVNTDEYDGGCIVGGKHVVGNARRRWTDTGSDMCWGATNDTAGNYGSNCFRADIEPSRSVWFSDSDGKLWKDIRT